MTDLSVFEPWPKTPRLRRDITITEKIDGTNGQISIRQYDQLDLDEFDCVVDGEWVIKAGSRNRWVRPGQDNAGFAAWVWHNSAQLVELLGVGRHFGEWWGPGIQQNPLDSTEKQFSLFNSHRWAMNTDLMAAELSGLHISCVPVLYQGPWTDTAIEHEVHRVRLGSQLNPMRQGEGVIVYHHASKQTFKVLCTNDELPKGVTTKQERDAAAELVST